MYACQATVKNLRLLKVIPNVSDSPISSVSQESNELTDSSAISSVSPVPISSVSENSKELTVSSGSILTFEWSFLLFQLIFCTINIQLI